MPLRKQFIRIFSSDTSRLGRLHKRRTKHLGRVSEMGEIENSARKLRRVKKQEQGGLPPSIPEVGDELLGLEEVWGCLRPLEKGKRGFLEAGLMDLTTVVVAGL